jgi:hypothetical protein
VHRPLKTIQTAAQRNSTGELLVDLRRDGPHPRSVIAGRLRGGA